jgi:hypothetical protein
MSDWVIVIADELHNITKRAYGQAEVDRLKKLAQAEVDRYNLHISDPGDHLAVTCNHWSEGTHWIVKATFFGSDTYAFAFLITWS